MKLQVTAQCDLYMKHISATQEFHACALIRYMYT